MLRMQKDTLELQYVISKGEIVKTPEWVRRSCGLDGLVFTCCQHIRELHTGAAGPHTSSFVGPCRCGAACLSEARASGPAARRRWECSRQVDGKARSEPKIERQVKAGGWLFSTTRIL